MRFTDTRLSTAAYVLVVMVLTGCGEHSSSSAQTADDIATERADSVTLDATRRARGDQAATDAGESDLVGQATLPETLRVTAAGSSKHDLARAEADYRIEAAKCGAIMAAAQRSCRDRAEAALQIIREQSRLQRDAG